MVNFRTEIETNIEVQSLESREREIGSRIDEVQFYLRVDLMFCEASEQEIKNPWQIMAPIPEEKLRKFTSSAQRLYKLNRVLKGIKEFYPVAFDNLHFSTVSLTIHSVLMGKHYLSPNKV